jgi:NAD(P)-dependent dehydrogenase (short-subunit alcohol dehydrogenase family)
MGSIKKALDLTGKTALITGGSRGLGLQIAEALGEQGARIVLSSRKAADLQEAQKHLSGLDIELMRTSSGLRTRRSPNSAGSIFSSTTRARHGERSQRIIPSRPGTR